MGRAPCCDKANVKKGPWSPDEDAKLKAFIDQHGTGGNWITLPSKAGLKRCGKSCRLRWINYLRPDIKHGSFTEEEELLIYKYHATIGSRWSLIAAQLPGRTDNDIKNYWNTRLKKKLCERKLDQLSSTPKLQRPSPPQDSFTSEKVDDAVMTISPNCKPNTTLNGMSSGGDGLLSQFMKPQQYSTAKLHDPTVLREAAAAAPMTSIRQQQPQVGVVKSEVPVVSVEAAADGAEVHEQLLRIESSLRSCISSHPSPASSCSGISTDRSTYAPSGAQCAESSYSDRDEQQKGIQDSDPLLPVMSSAVSPTLLVHSSVQAEVARGGEVPALEFGPLVDDDDVMQAALFAQDESSQTHNKSVLSGAKAEEYSFDRFDVNWWSTMMVNTPQKQTPGQRTLIAAAPKQQQHHQQQQHHHMQQQQYLPLQHRYGDTFVPTQLCLDPAMQCYMKPTSWNPSPSSCNGNASMAGSIAEYGMNQIRYGQQVSWDNVNWAETR